MRVLRLLVVLICLTVSSIVFSEPPASTEPSSEEMTRDELIFYARLFKNSISESVSNLANLQKSEYYYIQSINKSSSEHSNMKDLLFELSQLLENHYPAMNSSMSTAFSYLQKSAELGNSNAQHNLGTMYGTGVYIGSLVPMDAGRALLLDFVSALSGLPEANMAMGYRFANGIGVPESCELAKKHYEYAANAAAAMIQDRGYPLYVERTKLSEDGRTNKKEREVDEEVIDFYKHLAMEGDSTAALTLATMHITGSKVLEQDYDKAIDYLVIASRENSVAASGLLGYLLIQNLGSTSSRKLFQTDALVDMLRMSAKRRDINGITGLALAHLKGIGIQRNVSRAVELLQSVIGKHPDAGFHLGELYMGGANDVSVDVNSAMQGYAAASQKGNVLALHRLGHMSSTGIGLPKHCPTALTSFKAVAEKGDWMVGLTEAHKKYRAGEMAVALLKFSRFAALGVESAQFNSADILSKSYCPDLLLKPFSQDLPDNVRLANSIANISLDSAKYISKFEQFLELSVGVDLDPHLWQSISNRKDLEGREESDTGSQSRQLVACQARALQFYGLSASQHDAESMLRIGDIHYYGRAGVPVDKIEAAKFYQAAADLRHPHANFNLGIMYEAGDGVEQDFHLAKRFFDQAADFDPNAKFPRVVALFLLSSHRDLVSLIGQAELSRLFSIISPYLMILKDWTSFAVSSVIKAIKDGRNMQSAEYFLYSLIPAMKSSKNLLPPSLNVDKPQKSWFFDIYGFIKQTAKEILIVIMQCISHFTGQHIARSEILDILDQGPSVVTDMENYIIIGLILLLLLMFEVYRARRVRELFRRRR